MVNASTLLHPKEDKVKIQWKTYGALSEVPAIRFHLRGHTAGVCPQTQKARSILQYSINHPLGKG